MAESQSRADAANRVYVLFLGAAEGKPPAEDYDRAFSVAAVCPHMPSWARALRAGPDAVRYLKTRFPTYKERRQFVASELGPWLAHLEAGPCGTAAVVDAPPDEGLEPPAQSTASGPRVFLCHAKEDVVRVRQLYKDLSEAGLRPWLDEVDLLPGQDWKQIISAEIRRCDALIVCLSGTAITKTGYVQREIREAVEAAMERPEGRVFIVPVRFDDCQIPPSLGRWHAEDAFRRGGFQRLVAALRFQLEKAPATFPDAAPRRREAAPSAASSEEDGRPALIRVEATTKPHKDGVTLRLVVDATSMSPVNWLEGSFDGPRGNIWGGGSGRKFVEVEPQKWRFILDEEISRHAPSGVYAFRNLRVKNEAMLASATWETDVFVEITPGKP